MKPLNGIHHVTAITSSAERIYEFFTYVLGMRLVKKTINQDDINTYHLFFADDEGHAGTDMTFFDFQGIQKAQKGSDEIAKTSFRVPSDEALTYWVKRFDHYNVRHFGIRELFGIKTIEFLDFDDQEYVLWSDENDQGVKPGKPWHKGPVPDAYAIHGLGPVFLRVSDVARIDLVLSTHLDFKLMQKDGKMQAYEVGLGGNGARIVVIDASDLAPARQGFGGVHHVAFGVDDQTDLSMWIQKLNQIRAPHSGQVERFYFTSLYTRLYPGLLFEFATMGPGFIDDEESYENLGETLALPPRFRPLRQQIEAIVRHIDTKRSNRQFDKEYFD